VPREAYIKDGQPLNAARSSIGVHKSTLANARVLASEWRVTLAEAVDRMVIQSYREEFGRDPKGASQ